jgi:hypothetical protein
MAPRALLASVVGVVLALAAPHALAQEPRTTVAEHRRAPRPWDGVGRNTADAFLGWNALFHLAGPGATALMATQGVDTELHRFFARHADVGYAGTPGLLAGYIAPVAVVGGFHLAGWCQDDAETLGAGAAVLQAVTLSFGYTTLLKLLTGRRPPPDPGDEGGPGAWVDPADTFRFGFGRGGIYEGWPSGHTAAAVAIGVTLASYYDAWWVDLVGYTGVAYMMFSVTAFEGGVHWASDAVAGALMTYPIATSVGRGFRRQLDGEAERSAPVAAATLLPLVAPGRFELVVSGSF